MREMILPIGLLTLTCAMSYSSYNTGITNEKILLEEAYLALQEDGYTKINLGQPVISRFNGCDGELARKFSAVSATKNLGQVFPIVCKNPNTGDIRIARVVAPKP
jgi:hypothetical protein